LGAIDSEVNSNDIIYDTNIHYYNKLNINNNITNALLWQKLNNNNNSIISNTLLYNRNIKQQNIYK